MCWPRVFGPLRALAVVLNDLRLIHMNIVGAGRFKRIRRDESTDSEKGVINQPKKRIRQMSSDSDDDVVCLDREDSAATLPLNRADSSATQPYSLDSQRSDATEIYNLGSPKKSSTLTESVVLTSDPDKLRKIEFLSACFQGKTKLVKFYRFIHQAIV